MIKLEFNKPYKYGQLCDILGEPHLHASKQQTQIKKWHNLYEIEKCGSEYIIIKKYSEDEIVQNELRGMYIKLFSVVLSNMLLSYDTHSVSMSMMEILYYTNLVNADYKFCRYNVNDSSIILDTDPKQLDFYMTQSYMVLSRLVKDMLSTLEDKSLIIVRKGFRFWRDCGNFVETQPIPMGSPIESIILNIEKNVLDEIQCDSFNQLFKSSGKFYKFKTMTQKKCQMYFSEWDGYFSIYNITLNVKGLQNYNYNMCVELNQKIQTKLLESKNFNKINDLPKLIEATINLERPYKIKEAVEEYKQNFKF